MYTNLITSPLDTKLIVGNPSTRHKSYSGESYHSTKILLSFHLTKTFYWEIFPPDTNLYWKLLSLYTNLHKPPDTNLIVENISTVHRSYNLSTRHKTYSGKSFYHTQILKWEIFPLYTNFIMSPLNTNLIVGNISTRQKIL